MKCITKQVRDLTSKAMALRSIGKDVKLPFDKQDEIYKEQDKLWKQREFYKKLNIALDKVDKDDRLCR